MLWPINGKKMRLTALGFLTFSLNVQATLRKRPCPSPYSLVMLLPVISNCYSRAGLAAIVKGQSMFPL